MNKKEQSQHERDFAQQIKDFLDRTGISLSKMLNDPSVSYSNIEKVRDFLNGHGTITMRVEARIRDFMNQKMKG